jgi:hypothetical protein
VNDVRDWIRKKLIEQGYSSRKLELSQLEIERASRPRARVLCIGQQDGECFDAEDVDSCLANVPGTCFVVVVPTQITHAAYERAEERGICVAGFSELLDALNLDDDIGQHVDSRERYERRRLTRNGAVTSLKRKGHHAYEVRHKKLRPLTIITTGEYEFTVDELYSLLDGYEGIAVDVVVVTNPNCHGLSTDSQKAAKRAGISLALFDDFLDNLGTRWT